MSKSESRKKLIREHKRLVQVLRSPSHADDKREAKLQEKELKEYEDAEKSEGAVGKKISKLVHEGKPQKQAVAMAINMKREGRLTSSGGYKRVKKSILTPTEFAVMYKLLKK